MDYPAREGRPQCHPQDGSVQTYRGHHVLRTLMRARFSPMHSTGPGLPLHRLLRTAPCTSTVRACFVRGPCTMATRDALKQRGQELSRGVKRVGRLLTPAPVAPVWLLMSVVLSLVLSQIASGKVFE